MRKKTQTTVSTTAPWLLPGGHLLALRPDLLEVLRAMDGRSPREIRAETVEKAKADDGGFGMPPTDQPDPCEEEIEAGVAVVPMIGPVTQYRGMCDWMFGGCSLEAFMADIEEAAADPSVSAIVALIDSPGGEAAGVADAADRMRKICETKPIVAFVSGDGCSAAYWLASSCEKVVSSQTGLLGSIGVAMTYCDESKADEMAGIRHIEFVSSVSPNKRLDPATDAGKAQIQPIVDEYGTIFVGALARFRGVSAEKVLKDFGQGGVLIGANAVSAGLADKVGTLEDAIQTALALAQTSGSSTGETRPSTARSESGQGATNMTAKQLATDHPEAVAEIAAAAAQSERDRISGLLKYNTAAFRAIAADKIDAAMLDGKTTAGDLAVVILDAQQARNKVVADARNEDEVVVPEPHTPPDPATDATAKASKIDMDGIYAKLPGQAKREAN